MKKRASKPRHISKRKRLRNDKGLRKAETTTAKLDQKMQKGIVRGLSIRRRKVCMIFNRYCANQSN